MPTHSSKTILLATDQQRSVLIALDANQPFPHAWTPYGYLPHATGLPGQLGFNGELPDPLTGHFHLGKGYRQYSPVLMRFIRPDVLSPFGQGGLNAYAYCGGDPVNNSDPTGNFKIPALQFDAIFENAFELVTNRKAYKVGDFAKAESEMIMRFGGDDHLRLLATHKKTTPEAIIANAFVDRRKPARLSNIKSGEDLSTHLQRTSKYISELSEHRNSIKELLQSPKHNVYLSDTEITQLILDKHDIKKEILDRMNYSIEFRGPGPNTRNFNVERWNQAANNIREQLMR